MPRQDRLLLLNTWQRRNVVPPFQRRLAFTLGYLATSWTGVGPHKFPRSLSPFLPSFASRKKKKTLPFPLPRPLDAMLFGEGTRSLSQLRVAWEGVCAAAAFWMPCCGADCEFPFSRSTDGPDFQLSSRSATAECSTTRPGPGRAAATSTRASPTMSSMTLTRPRCATLLRGRLALSAKARARRCSRRARGLRAVPRACDAAL